MDRFTHTGQALGDRVASPGLNAPIPFRWWATPGYSVDYDRRERAFARPHGATIRAHPLAGVSAPRRARTCTIT